MSLHPETVRRQHALLTTALGPLATLLEEPDVVEVLINPDGTVWVERQGTALLPTGEVWSDTRTEALILTVAGVNGQVCTASQPSLSAVLPGSGARFQGFIPPATPAPSCILRRPASRVYALEEYVERQVMTDWQAEALRQAIVQKRNVVIAGQTGCGKTTLLSTLVALMADERLVTLEDTAEMQCPTHTRLALYATPGRPMALLLQEALRTRPDRIILGECRGVEAVDLLDSWGTGHPGGITTIHAGSPQEALTRLEACVRQVSPSHPQPLPLAVARPLIAQTVHLLVCLVRTPTGRRVHALARVHGLKGDDYALSLLEKGCV